MIIDGWECEELWPGTAWAMRCAKIRNVEWSASADGLSVEESGGGYSGYSGSHGLSANVFMWLAQAVR
jgi:hypothetical protein